MFGESYVDGDASKEAHAGSHRNPARSTPSAPLASASAGDGAPPPPHTRSVKEIIKTLDEEQDLSGPKGGCCSRLFIPFLTVAMIVIVFTAIVYTNGTGSDVEAVPRVALVVLDGFSGAAFHALMQSGVHLPNIASMLHVQQGLWAECATTSQSSCARAVVVENDTSGEVHVCAAAAMTSIFSGVPPRGHGVLNGSIEGMSMYATTSKTYPSLAKRVKDARRTVAVMGTSRVINSLSFSAGSCSRPGVLDMECAASQADLLRTSVDEYSGNVQLDCLAGSSCNINTRKTKSPTDPQKCSDGHVEMQFTRQLNSIFGGLAYATPTQKTAAQNSVADNLDDSLFIFHFDALAVRASSAFLPNFQYNASSAEYVAQAYLLDAQVGQVLSYVRDRAWSQKENWLVLGISDHGGSGKSFGTPISFSTADTAVAFFMATYTANTKQHVTLAPLQRPTTQLDVVPTVLTWLNVAPYDTTTNAVISGTNTTPADAVVERHVAERKSLDGIVQGICSPGASPKDCTAAPVPA
ncbi:Sulfatase [Novymonas esmeraldas]|uniref:Sulfatase n=1 Tax=Novymonas esmeraldas TaxID=1808958 RepID=A0AAW0F7W9_9TRYP